MQRSLFPASQVVGVFRGFREGGLEFHADLVLPYRNEFQNLPMHGQYLMVQLETVEEAVLGRITSFSSDGKLSSPSGEEFNIRAVRESRPVPEDLREQYLKYRVNIRVLGVLRYDRTGKLAFVASHRRLPHVGSAVAFPEGEVLREIAGHNICAPPLGHFALGEFVYADGSEHFEPEVWMQVKAPEVLVRFDVASLVSRRSFIFARAGFGKSNLNKLMFSQLYRETPMVMKRGGRVVPVGTVIFDPDGEYFWPDDKGRPGFCDVPHLADQLAVFTSRQAPSRYYGSFIAGGVKLDIRRLSPADVMAIALPPDRQDQQNVRKLRALDARSWESLVNLVDRDGHGASLEELAKLLQLDSDRQQAELLAARANATSVVRMLHDRSSQFMDLLLDALSNGKLCIVDVSQLRGGQSLILSGLILRRIFDRNQEQFTAASPKTIPTIAVVEEAQSVLNDRASAAEPYITWVKEGRKYDLGAVLVTQQPGSIPSEILSQGDNWFVFHVLSANDLTSVRRANAHFSDDLLSSLLNEPIPGQGVFWSSVSGRAYPVSVRVLSFEAMYDAQDPEYKREAIETYASSLRGKFNSAISSHGQQTRIQEPPDDPLSSQALSVANGVSAADVEGSPDILEMAQERAIAQFQQNDDLLSRIRGQEGVPWRAVIEALAAALPTTFEDRRDVAHKLVPRAMEETFGRQGVAWRSYKHPERDTTYVVCNDH